MMTDVHDVVAGMMASMVASVVASVVVINVVMGFHLRGMMRRRRGGRGSRECHRADKEHQAQTQDGKQLLDHDCLH